MYLEAIGWIYVAMMMAVAEATNTNGTVLGGIVTFLMYGLLPTGLVVYLMGAPGRNRKRKARERAEWEDLQANQAAAPVDIAQAAIDNVAKQDDLANSQAQRAASEPLAPTPATSKLAEPDASSHAPGAAQPGSVAPVRKEL